MVTRKGSKSHLRWAGRLLLWIAFSYVVLVVFLSVVFRLRVRPLTDAVRVSNKHVLNPAMMKLAGRKHWYTAVIRHTGRRSGKEYATPVVAEPIEESFIIPLPYGERVDWLKNVFTSGQATIEAKGESHAVVEPEVIDAEEAFPLFPPRLRRTLRLLGIERFLKVKRLSESS